MATLTYALHGPWVAARGHDESSVCFAGPPAGGEADTCGCVGKGRGALLYNLLLLLVLMAWNGPFAQINRVEGPSRPFLQYGPLFCQILITSVQFN